MSGGTVSYDEAIASIKSMFPTVDEAVIEAVLDANRGGMEPTIEQILAMTLENEAALSTPAPEQAVPTVGYGIPISGPSMSAVVPPVGIAGTYPGYAQQQPGVMQVGGVPVHPSSIPARPQRKWRHPIADDFLRIPGVGLPALPGGPNLHPESRPRSSAESSQVAKDEAFAAMLQNEVFIAQVQEDEELAEYIYRDPRGAAALGLPVHILLPAIQQAYGPGGPRGSHGGARRTSHRSTESAGSSGYPTGSTGSAAAGGQDWLAGMQRRLNTLAARFQRNNNAAASASGTPASGTITAAGGTGSGTGASTGPRASVSSWFSGFMRPAAVGYTGLPTAEGGMAAGGPTAGLDDSTLIPQAAASRSSVGASSRTDRVRRATGGLPGSPDGIEIELTESVGTGTGTVIGGDGGHGRMRGRTADVPIGVSGSINSGTVTSVTQSSDLSNAFAIDDDDEDESETTGLTGSTPAGGRRSGKHV